MNQASPNFVRFLIFSSILIALPLLASSCTRQENPNASNPSAPLTDKERQDLNRGLVEMAQKLQDAEEEVAQLQIENAQLIQQLKVLENPDQEAEEFTSSPEPEAPSGSQQMEY